MSDDPTQDPASLPAPAAGAPSPLGALPDPPSIGGQVWDVMHNMLQAMLEDAETAVVLRRVDLEAFDKKLDELGVSSGTGANLDRLTERRGSLEEEIAGLARHSDDFRFLVESVDKLKSEVIRRDELQQQALAQIKALEDARTTVEAKLQEAHQKLAAHEIAQKELTGQNDALQGALSAERTQVEALRGEVEALRTELKTSQDQGATMQQQLTAGQERLLAVEQSLVEAADERDTSKARISELERENEELARGIENIGQVREGLQRDFDAIKQEHEELQAQHSTQAEELQAKTAELSEKDTALSEKTAELSEKDTAAQKLQAANDQLAAEMEAAVKDAASQTARATELEQKQRTLTDRLAEATGRSKEADVVKGRMHELAEVFRIMTGRTVDLPVTDGMPPAAGADDDVPAPPPFPDMGGAEATAAPAPELTGEREAMKTTLERPQDATTTSTWAAAVDDSIEEPEA